MTDTPMLLYVFIFILTFGVTACTERILIPYLKKNAEQPIYEGGPSWHVSKSGTPTMGGLAFLLAVTVSLAIGIVYLAAIGEVKLSLSLITCAAFAIMNSIIGIIDDARKLSMGKNEGLRPVQKLVLQSISAILFLYLRFVLLGEGSTLSFSFGDVDIGFWYYPLAFLALVGATNCANLTDGIDGLASSVAFSAGAAVFFVSFASMPDVTVISAAVMGAGAAFLLFNLHPAKIFMGDTGSLFLGALLISATVALGNPLLILLYGIVYVIEGASVIIQVVVFKLTHKRVFKMAPLHHHLEKSGWSENKICVAAIIITLTASALTIPLYLI